MNTFNVINMSTYKPIKTPKIQINKCLPTKHLSMFNVTKMKLKKLLQPGFQSKQGIYHEISPLKRSLSKLVGKEMGN